MTFLPIVERELRRAARLNATYRNRSLAAGLAMMAALLMLVFGSITGAASQAGAFAFHVLSIIAVIFCLFEGVRKTADCLSEEKREGTLGLLFLTDLKGYDVVLGKLAATSLNSVYGLMAILPILALPLLVGGVTPGEYWRMVLALVNLLFFSLCTGMVVSAWNRDEGKSMSQTFLLVAILAVVPLWIDAGRFARISPVQAYRMSFASAYFSGARDYWQSIGITQAMSWLMLACACIAVPYSWQDRQRGGMRFSLRRSPGHPALPVELRAEMLNTNPALWLAGRNPRQGIFMWGLPGVTAVLACICLSGHWKGFLPYFIGYAMLINFMVKMRVAAQACHCLAEARQNNALEMLLSTPLTVNEIIRGQFLALQRIFLWPAISMMFVEIAGLAGGIIAESNVHNNVQRNNDLTLVFGMIGAMVYFVLFFLDLAAVAWAGMWFGLSSKKETQAVTKTILLVLVLPFASFFLCQFGLPFFIGIPIFWIAWGSQKLRSDFRLQAVQRFTPQPGTSGWLPVTTNQSPPPIPPV